MVGEEVSKITEAQFVSKKELVIALYEAAWKMELDLHKTKILEKYRLEFGEDAPQTLRWIIKRKSIERPGLVPTLNKPNSAVVDPTLLESIHSSDEFLKNKFRSIKALSLTHLPDDPDEAPVKNPDHHLQNHEQKSLIFVDSDFLSSPS
jgi:hypothetical protein